MQVNKLRLVLWLAGSLVLAESAAQRSGVMDIPAYEANNQIDYIPSPNQSGKFLHRNDYGFNEYSMGADRLLPDPALFNLMLLDDGIILGGNLLAANIESTFDCQPFALAVSPI